MLKASDHDAMGKDLDFLSAYVDEFCGTNGTTNITKVYKIYVDMVDFLYCSHLDPEWCNKEV